MSLILCAPLIASTPRAGVSRVANEHASNLGRPVSDLKPHKGGKSFYQHFKNGSACWYSPELVFPVLSLKVKYKRSTEKFKVREIHTFVASLQLPKGGGPQKIAKWILKSDRIEQDPGEEPNWVGREGWQVVEEVTRRLRAAQESRGSTPSVMELDVTRGETRLEEIDRGNYEAEVFSRDFNTA